MTQIKFPKITSLMLSIGFLTVGSASADSPFGSQDAKHDSKHEKRHKIRGRHGYQYKQNQDRSQYSGGRYFNDRDRIVADGFLGNEYRSGQCPPGLEKKSNGCVPPGQAKKWTIGQPLPQDVVYYDLPSELITEIGMPPPGYRYVRVASDILLIAIGSTMVMDAIYDLGLR
jgi:hypothetical protein